MMSYISKTSFQAQKRSLPYIFYNIMNFYPRTIFTNRTGTYNSIKTTMLIEVMLVPLVLELYLQMSPMDSTVLLPAQSIIAKN